MKLWARMAREPRGRSNAFSLVDVLVSMAVIAILISLLIPSLSGVRAVVEKVMCASNVHQHAIAIALYSDANDGHIPASHFLDSASYRIAVRPLEATDRWDGLGLLYRDDYLDTGEIFYCPGHTGQHPWRKYEQAWDQPNGEIMVNYQYRASHQDRPGQIRTRLFEMRPGVSIIADTLEDQTRLNHPNGANVLRADYSVAWFDDSAGTLKSNLPTPQDNARLKHRKVNQAWSILDSVQNGAGN